MGKTNDWLDFDQLVEDSVRDALKPPSMYKVILVNDDYTPMEFVIDVLQKFFSYDVERATQLMLAVHYQGKAICGVFTAEVAGNQSGDGEQVCKGERASVAVYAGKKPECRYKKLGEVPMLNQELELSLNMAFARAREHRHEFMTVEHLLLALLSNPSAREALEACSVDLVALRQELEAFIEQTTPVLPASEEAATDTQPTLSFQRVLQRAVFHVQSSGRSEVTGANVLVAIFSEQESQAAYLLRKHEVSRLDIVNFISHGTRKDEPSQSSDLGNQPTGDEQAGGEERMENFTTNLNQLARVGGIDPLIGREKELERAIQVLCRRRKNNPLLVGESGVGKTAIAEGLAWRIVQGDVPEVMADCTILLSGYRFAAGGHQIPWRF